MKREELRKILEGEEDIAVKIDQILDSYHSEIEPLKTDLKLAQDEKSGLEAQLKTAEETISSLEANTEKSESIAAEIENYKSQIQDLMKARDAEKIDNAVELAILQAKGKNSKAIKALLDSEKIRLEKDGTVSGIDEQIKTLTKTDSYMFETEEKEKKEAPAKSVGYNGPKGGNAEEKHTNKFSKFLEEQNQRTQMTGVKPIFTE